MPSCENTGVPIHFHSSTISGSASWISARMRASVSPRQSPSSLMRWSISLHASFPDAWPEAFFAFGFAFDFALDFALVATSAFSRCGQFERKRVHALLQFVGQHAIDQPLAFQSRLAGEGGGFQ